MFPIPNCPCPLYPHPQTFPSLSSAKIPISPVAIFTMFSKYVVEFVFTLLNASLDCVDAVVQFVTFFPFPKLP